MTGFNDPVSYNADLTYSGGVPATLVAAAATVTIDATAALDQRFRHWLDAAGQTGIAATSAVALTRGLDGSATMTVAGSSALSAGRAVDATATMDVAADADIIKFRRYWADAAAVTTIDGSAGLKLGGTAAASAPTEIRGRGVLARTRYVPIIVTVAGTTVLIRDGSLEIEQSIGSRSTARMTVIDESGMLRFDRGQQVSITDRGLLLWSGYVDSSQRTQPSVSPALVHDLTCIDQQYLADKRIAARTYEPGTTCGEVVADLHAEYLADEGVTLGLIEDGATLEQGMLVNYQPVSGALDALTDASDGYVWTIDQDRVLTFHHRSSQVAPWIVNGSMIRDKPEPQVTTGNPDYRNTQWILGGLAVTDPQTETRLGDGETQAWAMSYPLAVVPTIKLNGVAQRVGIKGLEDEATYDFGWNKGDPIISQASQATKLTSADTLTVTYQGQYAIVARVDDPTGIAEAASVEGGSGVVEQAISPGNINSAEQAFALAQARLDAYDRSGTKLTFDTDEPGLAAGQWCTVDLPGLGLSQVQMLIEQVRGQDRGDGHLRWSASAVDGPTTMPWQKVLGAPPELRKDDLVSVGSGTVVALVVSPRETAAWSEEIEEHPMTCPLLPYTLPVTLC